MYKKITLLTAAFSACFLAGQAQTLVTSLNAPSESFINEEVCWSIAFHHEGDPGYQPYVRLMIPPELPWEQVYADFMGSSPQIHDGGEFSGGTAEDPLLTEESPEFLVTGPNGYRLLVIELPVGSMVSNGVELSIEMCAPINGAGAEVGTPFDVQSSMVYLLGDTPTGENGPIVGPTQSTSITPSLYTFSKSASDTHLPTGECWPYHYTLSVDIADQQLVTNLEITDILPPDVQYLGWMTITPGCIVTQEPNVGSTGGTFAVSCDNAVGTIDGGDVTAQIVAVMTDQLDPMSCDSVQFVNNADAVSSQGALETTQIATYGYHVLVGPGEAGGSGVPGTIAPMAVEYAISEYVDGVDEMMLELIIPDGLSYAGNPLLNGVPISAPDITVVGPVAGVTTVTIDMHGANNEDFDACEQGTLTFNVMINETYNNGDQLMARDAMAVEGIVQYGLVNGTDGCTQPISVGYSVESVEILKEVVSTPAMGETYMPGETVTYRLTMTVPSEDVKEVVFEDLFPLPIHQVEDIDLTFGNDITWSPLDNAGISPQSIYIDEPTNKLFIDWGDVSATTSGVATVISVDIDVEVSTEPYASGLTHSNFARFYSSNTLLEAQTDVTSVSIVAAAPDLHIYKGIASTDNPDAILAPISTTVNADGTNLDAYDWITYQITIENEGASPAYDVIVNDFPDITYLENCSVFSVQTANGVDVPFTGNPFTTGLVIDEISESGADDNSDEIIITTLCQIKELVETRSEFTNTAQTTWASTAGNPDRFDPVSDDCEVTISRPQASKIASTITPGYGQNGDVHIGEVITYELDITIPEGMTRQLELSDVLPEGMAIEDIISLEVDDGITLPNTINNLLSNAQINDLGANPENLRRQMLMTIGDVMNESTNNLVDERLVVRYRAVVLNSDIIENGHVLTNGLSAIYNDPTSSTLVWEVAENDVTVVEPQLEITTELFQDQLLPGESTFITYLLSHTENSTGTAYDVDLTTDLPIGLELVEDSWILECEELLNAPPSEEFGSITARWDSIPLGVDCQITFAVEVAEAYPPCSFINNQGEVEWSSTWNTHMDTLSYGPQHTWGVERTGNILDVGDALNDYKSTSTSTLEVISESTITPIITGQANACIGETITLEIPEYAGIGVVYNWTGPGVPPGFNSNVLNIYDASATDIGDYQVHVEIGDCLTELSNLVSVVVNDAPVVDLPDVDIACSNGTEDIVISPEIDGGGGPFDFFWTGPGFSSSDAEAVIPNAGEDDQGVYTLYVIDGNDCISNTSSSTVSVTNSPEFPVITPPTNGCEGDELEFTCNTYQGDVLYHWNTPAGEIVTTLPVLVLDDPESSDSGDYTVWVDVNDCTTDESIPESITVYPTPATPELNLSDTEICEGEDLVLSTSAIADDFHWTGPNGYESFLETPPVVTDVSEFEAGTYTLSISVDGCESAETTQDLTVLPRPDVPDLASNSPLCEGEDLELTTTSSASEFVWIDPSGSEFSSTTSSWTFENVSSSDSGGYSAVVFDGSCYSEPSTSIIVQVDVIPAIGAYAGPDVYVCDEGMAFMAAVNDSPYGGIWTTDEENLTITNPESETTTITGANTGSSYSLTWSLYNQGCGVFSTDTVMVLAPTEPLAEEDIYEVVEGEVMDLFVLMNDGLANQNVNLSIVEAPLHAQGDIGLNEYVIYETTNGYYGPDEFTYEICLAECPNICDTALVRLDITPYLEIPDVITPNNDGTNDTFMVRGIENFPENELCVYNRWGHEVYRASNYQNDWEGTWQGQPLPEGTYFYVFMESGINEAVAQGYVVIHR